MRESWGTCPPSPRPPRGCRRHPRSSCQRLGGCCRVAWSGCRAVGGAGIVIPAEARQGAAAPRAPRNGLRPGTGMPGILSEAGRVLPRGVVGVQGGRWRRDCHPGGSRQGGSRPLSNPRVTAGCVRFAQHDSNGERRRSGWAGSVGFARRWSARRRVVRRAGDTLLPYENSGGRRRVRSSAERTGGREGETSAGDTGASGERRAGDRGGGGTGTVRK